MNKNKLIRIDNKKMLVCLLILFSITFCVFSYTIEIRKPWFNTLSEGHHQWLTGSTIKFTKMWLREGPLNLKFGMFEDPSSIETPALKGRLFYSSYPPGTILPIYIICKLRGFEPTPFTINSYNLLNHFLIAFFLSLTLFLFLLQIELGVPSSLALSTFPVFIELLMPAPLYWHQNVFFSDQAIILPFVLVIFLEVLRDNVNNKKMLLLVNVIQSMVFLYGYLTDWFFCFVGVTVYLKRILNGEIKGNILNFTMKSFLFWLPLIVGLFLFLLQLVLLNGLETIVNSFIFRTGLSSEGRIYIYNFFEQFWRQHIASGYGLVAIYLLWGSLIVLVFVVIHLCIKKINKNPIDYRILKCTSLTGILLVPCFMEVYFFRNHSVIHDFSALKFSVPLSLVPFVLIPIIISQYLENDLILNFQSSKITYKNRDFLPISRISITILLLSIILFTYIKSEHYKFKGFFPMPDNYEAAQFIANNTDYEDIVFSPHYEIKANPPQKLSYSMKRVYKINTIDDVYQFTKNIKGNYIINFFFINEQLAHNTTLYRSVVSASKIKENDKYILCKISNLHNLKKI